LKTAAYVCPGYEIVPIYLAGTELDFSDGLNGKGFNFHNPNASRTCGCGESFSVIRSYMGVNFAPFLWTKEGKDIQKVSRKPISIEEQYIFNMDAIKQLKQ
jgi:hypothetical protein